MAIKILASVFTYGSYLVKRDGPLHLINMDQRYCRYAAIACVPRVPGEGEFVDGASPSPYKCHKLKRPRVKNE